jgi:hypothetical protein
MLLSQCTVETSNAIDEARRLRYRLTYAALDIFPARYLWAGAARPTITVERVEEFPRKIFLLEWVPNGARPHNSRAAFCRREKARMLQAS